jgi:hypothetical protein
MKDAPVVLFWRMSRARFLGLFPDCAGKRPSILKDNSRLLVGLKFYKLRQKDKGRLPPLLKYDLCSQQKMNTSSNPGCHHGTSFHQNDIAAMLPRLLFDHCGEGSSWFRYPTSSSG